MTNATAGTEDEVDAAKRALRRESQARRDAIGAADRQAGSLALAKAGIAFARPDPGLCVSAYMAMGSEIDPQLLVERLHAEGSRICLPVVQPRGQPLVFRAWAPGEPLVARLWGIREPADTADVVEPDILLVPLLAFDREGFRLGYGGGYYDRTLARLRAMKPVTAIGLAFAEQEVAAVPRGRYDEPLDWLFTPALQRQAARTK